MKNKSYIVTIALLLISLSIIFAKVYVVDKDINNLDSKIRHIEVELDAIKQNL